MPLLILGALLAILIYVPAFWVRRVMSRHSGEIPELPGTGGELAQHLIERFKLHGISVEETTPLRDHFDPADRVVRLGSDNFHGKSITAVAVAAHEVGHAIQFHRQEKIFELRKRYMPQAMALNRAGIAIMWCLPVVGFFLRSPFAIGAIVALSLLLQLAGALTYLIVLPEEWDASFNKALPILKQGNYLAQADLPKARKVLRAAALTYFAGALANVLNIARWLLILRR
jgi:Zn-dependent membrane protease YugP